MFNKVMHTALFRQLKLSCFSALPLIYHLYDITCIGKLFHFYNFLLSVPLKATKQQVIAL